MATMTAIALAAALVAASAPESERVPLVFSRTAQATPGSAMPSSEGVRPGDKLQLVIAAGPVSVEREVEAMQAAKPGHTLFVKTTDGEILTVRFGGDAP